MNSPRASISKVLTTSFVDGPGNRLVLFFQGCNFNCKSCHNPHTIGLCNHCGECIPSCTKRALEWEKGEIHFVSDRCDQCDVCLDHCPIKANPMVQSVSVDDLLGQARDYLPFLNGITVSGGEATLQWAFVAALFAAVKSDPALAHLTCFIDTNGHLETALWKQLIGVTDGAMVDIKAFDPVLHLALTGRENQTSLQSAKTFDAHGKLYELRYLMIPGKTDSHKELDLLIRFARTLNTGPRIKLNAFQHHGVKGEALGWEKMSQQKVEAAADYLRSSGIDNVITPSVYL